MNEAEAKLNNLLKMIWELMTGNRPPYRPNKYLPRFNQMVNTAEWYGIVTSVKIGHGKYSVTIDIDLEGEDEKEVVVEMIRELKAQERFDETLKKLKEQK